MCAGLLDAALDWCECRASAGANASAAAVLVLRNMAAHCPAEVASNPRAMSALLSVMQAAAAARQHGALAHSAAAVVALTRLREIARLALRKLPGAEQALLDSRNACRTALQEAAWKLPRGCEEAARKLPSVEQGLYASQDACQTALQQAACPKAHRSLCQAALDHLELLIE